MIALLFDSTSNIALSIPGILVSHGFPVSPHEKDFRCAVDLQNADELMHVLRTKHLVRFRIKHHGGTVQLMIAEGHLRPTPEDIDVDPCRILLTTKGTWRKYFGFHDPHSALLEEIEHLIAEKLAGRVRPLQ